MHKVMPSLFPLFYRMAKTFRNTVSSKVYDALFFRGSEMFFNKADDETFFRVIHDIGCPSCGNLYRVVRSVPALHLADKIDTMNAYFSRPEISDKARARAATCTKLLLEVASAPASGIFYRVPRPQGAGRN